MPAVTSQWASLWPVNDRCLRVHAICCWPAVSHFSEHGSMLDSGHCPPLGSHAHCLQTTMTMTANRYAPAISVETELPIFWEPCSQLAAKSSPKSPNFISSLFCSPKVDQSQQLSDDIFSIPEFFKLLSDGMYYRQKIVHAHGHLNSPKVF